MSTYITKQPAVGELRWLARIDATKVPYAAHLGATTAGGKAIEASDVVSILLLFIYKPQVVFV